MKQEPTSSPHSRHYISIPRIANFSGAGADSKDVTYEAWRYEVRNLLLAGHYVKSEVTTAAIKSLRGEAAQTVRRLDPSATLDEVFTKLDPIYSRVEDEEDLFKEFYSAVQSPTETAASWACRCEEILHRACLQTKLDPATRRSRLLKRFFRGLQEPLREKARLKAATITDFNELLVEVRRLEAESPPINSKPEPRKAQVKQAHTEVKAEEDASILQTELLLKISSRMDALEEVVRQQPQLMLQQSQVRRPNPPQQFHQQQQQQLQPQQQQQQYQQQQPHLRDRGNGRNRGRQGRGQR